MRSMVALILAGLSGMSISCHRAPTSTSDRSLLDGAVASVAGSRIERGEFEAELARRARVSSESLLEEMIESEAVYVRAKEAGFDQKPEIARQIKRLIVSQFIEAQLNVSKGADVSELEAKKYYDEQGAKYATPEQARFAVIFLGFSVKATAEAKQAVKAKANEALKEARELPASERAFGSLAQRYSEDQATRYARGDAGWVSRNVSGRWGGEVMDAVFSLTKPGELAPLIENLNGYYLVKLIGRKEAGRRSFEEVKAAISYQLAQQKRQQAQDEFYESMKAGLPIQINHPLLESIVPPTVSQSKPPGVPAG